MTRLVHSHDARVALIGTGQLAQALAQRVVRLCSRHGGSALVLAQVFNSRGAECQRATDWLTPVRRLADWPGAAAATTPS